jgi:hypothetical protein
LFGPTGSGAAKEKMELSRQLRAAQQQIHALESEWQARQHEQIGEMKNTSSSGIHSSQF